MKSVQGGDQLGKTRRNPTDFMRRYHGDFCRESPDLASRVIKGAIHLPRLKRRPRFNCGSDLFLIDGSVGPLELEVRKEGLFV